MAALFMLALARLGISPALPAFLVAIAGLVALGSIDLELYILPVRVLYPTLVATAGLLVLAAFVGHEWSRLLSAAIGGLLLTGMFFVIHRCAPPMLGFGDVRLAALVGGCLGWFGVGATEIGFLAGNALALAVAIIRIRRGSATRRTPIPYGTFLSLGAIIGMFAGPPLSSLVIR
jgi:leader peptidase (prepilin peptidase)/N-methyltransferase